MRLGIINHFACPVCRADFLLLIHKKTRERVIDGELRCKKCDRLFYIKGGIACFDSCQKKLPRNELKKLRQTTIEQEIPKKWMNNFSKEELTFLKKEWNWMLAPIKKNKNAIHLDFATGTGRFLRNIISKIKGEIIALDNGLGTCQELQYFLKRIKGYKKVSIVCADARKMPFKNGVFDNVSSWHGLDEPKMEEAIRETKRVLKKKGYLIASGLHYQEDSKSFLIAKKHHINFITKEAIIKTLEKAKFRNIEHRIFFCGKWNERESYLPVFGDFYSTFAIRARK
jgi:SAM-dependent methyltransferase